MNSEDYISWWIKTAEHDWKAVENMMKSKDYVHALFFSHLVLEKLLKAHWIKDNNNNHPPKIHNLQYLSSKINIVIAESDKNFLGQMNAFQLEGRYPEYKADIYKIYKLKKTKPIIERVNEIRKWLLQSI